MVNQIEINSFYKRHEEKEYFKNKNIILEAWSPLVVSKNNIFSNPALLEIANKHSTTNPLVVCKWLIDRNIIPLVKSTNVNHTREYQKVFDINLDETDIKKLNSFNTDKSVYFSHRDYQLIKMLCERKL